MASNARLSEFRGGSHAFNRHAYLPTDLQRRSTRPFAANSQEPAELYDLGLRAGVQIQFTPDGKNEFPKSLLVIADAIKEIEKLAPDWDSYGASQLSDAAVLPALKLAIMGVQRCRQPTVLPLATGGLGLRWTRDDIALEIDVSPEGLCTGFLQEGDHVVEEIDDPTQAETFVQLVGQFCRID